MEETLRTCPTCGRSLGPKALRCFYCGPKPGAPEPAAPPMLAPSPAPAPAPAPAAMEAEPNTRCPICKNPVAAQVGPKFSCPSCQAKLECLFAAPAKLVPKKTLSQVCVFHPEVQAISRCRTCRKAVCETCAFRARMGVYCPDCASAPDEAGRSSTLWKGVASLVLGILSLIAVVFMFVLSATGQEKAGELMATLCLFLSIGGAAFGFTSRDPARGRSLVGLIGLIVNCLLLGIFVLLILVNIFTGGK